MEQRLRNGSKNPLEMSDEGARTEGIQLTGFVVGWPGGWKDRQTDHVTFFFRARTLPPVETATTIYHNLEKTFSNPKVLAVIRTDSRFDVWGGADYDRFDLPLPDLKREDYIHSEYLECSSGQACRKKSLFEIEERMRKSRDGLK